MAKVREPLEALGQTIETLAGSDVRQAVMQGHEQLKDSSAPHKVALWVQGAMQRLDEQVEAPLRRQIMAQCGENCAAHNQTPIQRAVARRKKFASEADFLQAEVTTPPPGMRLEREGEVLYQYYTPQAFTHPMRCYCSLLRGLPADEQTSLTYCECSRAFVQTYWTAVLGRPVQVDLLASCVAGAAECRFAVRLS